MKKESLLLIIGLCVVFVALLYVEEAETAPDPGRKKSGGGWFGSKKSSSNTGSSWFGSNKKKNNYNNNYNNNNNVYKKKSKYSTLKKAAVIGLAAYGGYQLGKLSGRFGGWGYGHQHGYGFNDWNRWREIDGFMCRDSNDCNWIDPRLYCQDYELDFTPSVRTVNNFPTKK